MVLIVEVDGPPALVDDAVERVRSIGLAHGARSVRVASRCRASAVVEGVEERIRAIVRINPYYDLHDTVVPRRRLVEVLREVYAIADKYDLIVMNAFHVATATSIRCCFVRLARAGAPCIVCWPRARRSCRHPSRCRRCALGEHGIGIEKRDFMPMLFSPDDLDAEVRPPRGLRPGRQRLPAEGAPRRFSARRPADGARGGLGLSVTEATIDLASFAEQIGTTGAVAVVGGRTQWDVGGAPEPDTRLVPAPAGIAWIAVQEMTVCCGAGTLVTGSDAALAERGQCVALPDWHDATVGGCWRSVAAAFAASATGRFATLCFRLGSCRQRGGSSKPVARL